MNELKKCPFCGSDADVVWAYDGSCQVLCDECHCRTPKAYYNKNRNFVRGGLHFKRCETSDEARAWVVSAWNKRYENEVDDNASQEKNQQ